MKDEYIDHYGVDSLNLLKDAVRAKAEVFITSNEELLADKEELEDYFDIYIMTPEEFKEWDREQNEI